MMVWVLVSYHWKPAAGGRSAVAPGNAELGLAEEYWMYPSWMRACGVGGYEKHVD